MNIKIILHSSLKIARRKKQKKSIWLQDGAKKTNTDPLRNCIDKMCGIMGD